MSSNGSGYRPVYAKPLSIPAVVYVDDNWVGLPNGTVVDADPGPGVINATIGTDAFATIQAGVNAVDPGGTVNVLAGTYTELVTVNKTVTLGGAQQGVDARTRPFVAANESIVNNPGGSFSLQANNVVLDGFTVQGTTAGSPLGTGIYLSGLFSGYNIRNNIVQNNIFGLYPHSSGSVQTIIQQNLFQNNNNSGAANGNGIYSDQGLSNALIDNNRFTNNFNSAILITRVSITNTDIIISNNQVTSSSFIVVGGTTNALITGNTVANSGTYGIWLFGGNGNITVLRNSATSSALNGLNISNSFGLGPNQNLHLDSNTLTGNGFGIRVEAGALSGSIDANCNFIQGNTGGLRNDETDVVDATLNWWGNVTGPTHPSNPGGTGQSVVGSAVNLLPFATNTVTCVGLSKTASASSIAAGTRLTYTLVVSNAGATTASGVVLTDTLPAAGVTYATANPTPTGTSPLTWTVGTVTPGQTLTYTVVVTVNANTTGNLTNTAILLRAAPTNTVTAMVTTSVTSVADLLLTKQGTPDPVAPGASLTYTLSITNGGPSNAAGVVVTDNLPNSLTFGGAAGAGWSCNHSSGVVTCTAASLLVGVAPNIIITGTAPLTSGVMTNTAGVTSTTPDSSAANNTATITTTVQPSGSPPAPLIYLPIIKKNS
ncbi:MAG: DUF11 domain-containing protein [Chloroflexi bacterium]|nr:DUF11 domain-containing protein [Chloroflexota bacterium]